MAKSSKPLKQPNARQATIFVFGGHIGPQTKNTLEKPVRQILDGPNAEWILETVAELPRYWEALVEKIPDVAGTMPGARLLADFDSWLRNGVSPDDLIAPDVDLPDIMVGILMVAIQLDQYWRYLEYRLSDPAGKDINDLQAELVQQQQQSVNESDKVEMLGFCAGIIGAVAVASSHDRREFKKYGAVALRIGMLMAVLVHAREEWDKGLGKGGSVSLATAWRTPKQGKDMGRIVSSLSPDAYVSVLFDEARATVTTSERFAPTLVRQLRAAGVTAIPLSFKGHLHSPNEEQKRHTDSLIELCHRIPELQFPGPASLALPSYGNQLEGEHASAEKGDTIGMVLRTILVHQFDWHTTVSRIAADESAWLVAFGLDRCLPPTLQRRLGEKQVHFEDLEIQVVQARNAVPSKATPSNEVFPSRQQPQTNGIGSHPDEAQRREVVRSREVTDKVSSLQPKQDSAADKPRAESEGVFKEEIAIVGMSIKVSGADDVSEFAELLKTGASQHELITHERMMQDMIFRERPDADPNKKYYGNFVRDSDAFDHKFFKRSPRESQAMDPQSRLSLQAAYQAVEQSGYFTEIATTSTEDHERRKHVGMYLGVCGVDYEQNISCHSPSAFTATGALRSFISGKVSHYFGWTGPSMTFDTACSSSTVAIHTACKDLLSGDTSAALCGGANIMTNMQWIQNLSAGSFLSPTGQCKPFDADADGYCRAEGFAFVFLKKMSDAVADGNTVLGTIRATGVYQNQNVTPLFVPNVPSLSRLFKDVIKKSRVEPHEISLVETHGTGTPVGDPAEYESVRLAVADPLRQNSLPIGSVKGHIGHTEGASGVIALVKVLMMMRENFIPPQANFKRMNARIHAQPADKMEVVTSLRPWPADRKFALINNYGACGSNASMVVGYSSHKPTKYNQSSHSSSRFPFRITGLDARSIAAYTKVLAPYLRSRSEPERGQATLRDISYNMSRQSNPSLPQGLIFSCASLIELQDKLSQAASSATSSVTSSGIAAVKPERPVVLCFGGQFSNFVGLDRALYDGVAVLRHHLDECDTVIKSLGLNSIFPDIFSRVPLEDTVQLQTALFAMQYACAKSWLDCGLASKVVSLVGHSFGEITALCVAGVLSLEDTIKLVAGRARLVRDAWGSDPGAMMAIEADESLVRDLVKESNLRSDGSVSIACYNSSRCFTLAGSTRGIDSVAEMLTENDILARGIKSKRLKVTNAFHSKLVDGIIDRLGEVGRELNFRDAAIPIERATEHGDSAAQSDWTFVPSHMREPVFFNHAVQRLFKKHPQAIFLEAASNSTITTMAARALSQAATTLTPTFEALHFQSLSITNTDKGFDGLTDATISLWKQGLRVSFWPHHPLQAREYEQLLLPPYQFEKSRHWLELKSPTELITKTAQEMIAANGYGLTPAEGATKHDQDDPKTLGIWTFVGYQDQKSPKKRLARFRINTASDQYQRYFATHVIAQTAPICPATLEIDMAIEALFSLNPDWRPAGFSPVVHDMLSHSPMCADSTRVFYIDLTPLDKAETQWHFSIHSVSDAALLGDADDDAQKHAEARIHIRSPSEPAYLQEFGRYERLVSHAQCQALLKLDLEDDGVEVLQGRNVYRAFSPVVEFGQVYRGVRCVVGRDGETAGVVHKRHHGETWLDVPLSDSFGQVAGIYVNLMAELPPADMFVATGCELTMRSPRAQTRTEGMEHGAGVWHVLARHTRQSDKAYVTDVFVFDAATGALTEVIMGLQYARVAKASMSKILARLTADKLVLRNSPISSSSPTVPNIAAPIVAVNNSAEEVLTKSTLPTLQNRQKRKPAASKTAKPPKQRDVTADVRSLVANVSGIEESEMTLDSEMADLGIDSLMSMELAREVENTFKCTLDQAEMMEARSLRQFVACVSNALASSGGGDNVEQDADSESDDGDDDSSSAAAAAGGGTFSDQSQDYDTVSDVSVEDKAMGSPGKKSVPGSLQAQVATSDASSASTNSNLRLSRSDILECFGQVKLLTDDKIHEYGLDNIANVSLAGSNRLCAALIVEAFDELGSALRNAAPGQTLERVPFLPQHARLMEFVYEFLERHARLIDIDIASGQLTRTHITAPRKTSEAVLEELLVTNPESAIPNRLAYYAGKNLAGVLSGTTDGIRVIFGCEEGRELVQSMYCDYPFNRMHYQQMAEVVTRLAERIKTQQPGETLKVLEMGGGTGGTTNVMAPLLASLGIPVEYTFTDLSPSMVAKARRKFAAEYPFMRFAVHDIEKIPAAHLCGQHIVLASNAIHATRSLVVSGRNVHQALRPDGFLMVLEMTEGLPFMDIIFGLLEGWWLFEDGRPHAVVPAENWESALHMAGFGHVDWTDGYLPEHSFQKVIIALASGPTEPERLPKSAHTMPSAVGTAIDRGDIAAREAEAERLVAAHTVGWTTPALEAAANHIITTTSASSSSPSGAVVLVTGATGGLGSHLVQALAEQSNVSTVVCVNRHSSKPADRRQADALSSRGIQLSPSANAKLRIYQTDTSKPRLGLPAQEHAWLVQHGTHIIHNAWPMSGTRPLKALEPQAQVMRNLLDLARDMATRNTVSSAGPNKTRIGFQFVSSIGVVGYSTEPRVLEEHVPMASVIPGGYTEAKWVCERMLAETLQQHPQLFRATVARPGQIAGSTRSGVWNPVEHFAFLVKSAQALRAWPDLQGVMQWLPVDRCAGVMVDLLKIGSDAEPEYPVYHVDNPVGQPWKDMSPVLAAALDIPPHNIISFADLIKQLRRSPLSEAENPAARAVDFLEGHFERMSCGGIILDTQRTREHSETMAVQGPVSAEVVRSYVSAWKMMGFLEK